MDTTDIIKAQDEQHLNTYTTQCAVHEAALMDAINAMKKLIVAENQATADEPYFLSDFDPEHPARNLPFLTKELQMEAETLLARLGQ